MADPKIEYDRICLTIRHDQKEALQAFPFINMSGLYQLFLDEVITELKKIMENTDKQVITEINKIREEKRIAKSLNMN